MLFLIPHVIDRAADSQPEKDAFRFEGTSISYSELVRRANGLAHLLQEQGVRKGDRVGVLLRKGLESAVGIFGIMKAGAAYVPLDVFSPARRIESAIQHLGIRHLVTQEGSFAGVSSTAHPLELVDGVVGVSEPRKAGQESATWDDVRSRATDTPPDIVITEDDIAYIMFTSGSTGTPKGIIHTHRSGLSYARTSADLYDILDSDRLSNHSPLHFDMSTFDYFTGPLARATTIIISEGRAKLPASLSELIESERLTIWYSVPFALIQLLLRGALDQRDLSSLRWVLFGGEPFPPKYVEALTRRLPSARFSNVYGPAEVNQCTYYHIPHDWSASQSPSIPLGKIWPNAEGMVVDEEDRPVVSGADGELLVRTPTMMQGYWDDSGRNAAAFYDRVAPGRAPERFYRTGDLVREDDGNLMFLGRKDRQVKVRGYRVELDEIEAALASDPSVEEAAAYTVVRDEGVTLIQASVIPAVGAVVKSNELVKSLKGKLPPYSIPASISVTTTFPRTGSGKIDRVMLRKISIELDSKR